MCSGCPSSRSARDGERRAEDYEDVLGLKVAELRKCGSIEVLPLTEKLKGDRSDYEERLPMSSPSGYAKLPDYNRGEPGYKLQRPF